MHSGRCLPVLPLLLACLACNGDKPCSGGRHVSDPRGNSVGEDRIGEFKKVIDCARRLPRGRYLALDLPQHVQIDNLLGIEVYEEDKYALWFKSPTRGYNPIYVFIEDSVRDPDAIVSKMEWMHKSWHCAKKLDEPGWYYVRGEW